MDKISQYREAIKQVLNEFIDYISGSPSSTDTVMVADDEQQVYTVFDLGWENGRRIQIMPVLIRIVGDKVYVEEDNTDYGFVDRLLEADIPAKDMVLAWHPPDMRPYTEFAVA
jgi:hypothetical protein